uniref:UBZ1-type domain-containing protein n=1 Tax=Monodelphis domestica TaxID=13616 RepID=A0A5F8HED6_MONDO
MFHREVQRVSAPPQTDQAAEGCCAGSERGQTEGQEKPTTACGAGEQGACNHPCHRNQISDLMKRLDESKFFYQELQKEKTRVEGEKDLLQKENERLLCYVCNDSGSNLLSNPIPVQEALEENTGLVFGNPYAAAQDIQYIPILPSIKKCPICHGVFPDDVEENVFEQHLQTHILDCPFCDEVFSEAERQVYDDHVFCHSL